MKSAPPFELNEQSLDDLLRDRPALLVFFKISCPVCQLTLPYLNRMKNGALRIVAISQDDEESTAEFHEAFHISLETLFDSEAEGYAVSDAFGITNVPTMFLVEQDRTISETIHGFVKRQMEALGERCGIAPFGPGDSVPAWKPG